MDFINETLDIIKKLVNNENYLNLISIFVVAITTYYVAKYNALKPSKLKIKQQQLDNVYLPLFRLFNNMNFPLSTKSALLYSKKLNSILEKNYILAFPRLHDLNRDLKSSILSNGDYEHTLKCIKHQVDIDYELLKKALGYPSQNFYDLFIRMTFKQKVEWIISWVNVFLVFGPLFLVPFLSNLYPNNFLSVLSIVCIITFFLLIKVNSLIKKIKD